MTDTTRVVVWIYNLALEFLAVAAVLKFTIASAQYWRGVGRQSANTPATENEMRGAWRHALLLTIRPDRNEDDHKLSGAMAVSTL
jgi:hypothetical protein